MLKKEFYDKFNVNFRECFLLYMLITNYCIFKRYNRLKYFIRKKISTKLSKNIKFEEKWNKTEKKVNLNAHKKAKQYVSEDDPLRIPHGREIRLRYASSTMAKKWQEECTISFALWHRFLLMMRRSGDKKHDEFHLL